MQQDHTDCTKVAQHALVLGPSGHDQSDPTVPAQSGDSGTGSCNRAPLMAIVHQLLTSWETSPLMSAKMRISPVSWIVSTETDPRVIGAIWSLQVDLEQQLGHL